MGEIADMMLDGTLCEGCGVYLRNSLGSFPQRCNDCKRDEPLPVVKNPRRKLQCPDCNKHVTEIGMADHRRDKHGK